MDIQHITGSDYPTSTWAGGITRQIAIYPEDAQYADRDFAWRLSSARVDLEQSDFTPLPDYDRFIAVLAGSIQLSHEGGAWVQLAPYRAHAFDGAAATRCLGRCTDFNLMLRKDTCQGSLEAVTLLPRDTLTLHKPGQHALAVFCAQGEALVQENENAFHLQPDDTLVLQEDAGDLTLTSAPGAVLMVARIQQV